MKETKELLKLLSQYRETFNRYVPEDKEVIDAIDLITEEINNEIEYEKQKPNTNSRSENGTPRE